MDDSGADGPPTDDGATLVGALPEPLATRWPPRLGRLRADKRRGVPFAVAAAWPLAVASSLSLLERCDQRPRSYPPGHCLAEPPFLLNVGLALVEVVVGGLLAAVVLYTLVGPRVERALDDRLGRLLFEPGRPALVVLAALHLAAFVFGGLLLNGGLVEDRWAFFVLAVPLYPLVGGVMITSWTNPLFDAATAGLAPTVGTLFELPWLVAVTLVTVALNVVWLHLLAGTIDAAWAALAWAVADRR